MIRPAVPADAPAIADIYDPYVRATTITFEEDPVTAEEMAARIVRVSEGYPWLVLEEEGRILGYAYSSLWRTRAAYRYATETAIYLAEGQRGRGLGETLYRALIDELRQRGFHSALGCLALPNDPSVRLHERLGFRKAGHMREAGRKFDRWVDVGFWELLL
ncbi:arsinothricin resistance N-acetyltransferase ArsN1 family B [Geothrix sp. 21YS21S-4]|uniref:arsinothricin resistance N-acetyltransferase ArsN1 family B n=1 Tax=Geothrix sp. 21YS21S-4 TaxID=3068889 RepID=UPI0027BAAB6C|nr:arsinothricin resistance N-acetyltransferase ArsN1 family B [Geothrix sp. 21YS21S-4]